MKKHSSVQPKPKAAARPRFQPSTHTTPDGQPAPVHPRAVRDCVSLLMAMGAKPLTPAQMDETVRDLEMSPDEERRWREVLNPAIAAEYARQQAGRKRAN